MVYDWLANVEICEYSMMQVPNIHDMVCLYRLQASNI